METFKPIPGYSDYYEISDKGNIRSLDRYVETQWATPRLVKGKLMKRKITPDGYRIGLFKNGKQKFYFISNLVAVCFIPNPGKKEFVYFKDMDNYNPAKENLIWVTREELNEVIKYANRLSGKVFKLNNHRSKKAIVDGEEYPSQSELSRKNNMDIGTVNHAINKRYGYTKARGKTIKSI